MGTFKFIPLLVLVALVSFSVRIGEVITGFKNMDQAMSASVTASDTPSADAHGGEAGAEGENTQAAVDVPSGLGEDDPLPMIDDKWADPTTLDLEYTGTQSGVVKELKDRRAALDARESRVSQREALLTVTEKRIEEKIAELDALRQEIEELLGNQSEEENARINSLVKIYEGMKPKDAAAIFDNLDMDVLLQIVGRMSERKSAPVIASMNTQKAQELTLLLAEQKALPEMPQ